ncbi:MAG: tripartite tricarboxylate transporter TctB family protein [Syntrophus sp. (in: bacteria)]|nr:tripartite tricarboxylate transporter TctB family protein [Syntrophus sp. (in: bacteria)]
MKLAFRNNRDFWAGLMFAGIGASAMFIARNYPFGNSLRMGPGYFPRVLGGVLILFGAYVMVRGLRSNEKIGGNWSIRALIVLPLAMVLFGVLMDSLGFIPALAALIFGSAAASREFKFVEVLLLTVLLTSLSMAMFIWGLGLPYPLIKIL